MRRPASNIAGKFVFASSNEEVPSVMALSISISCDDELDNSLMKQPPLCRNRSGPQEEETGGGNRVDDPYLNR